MQGEGGRGCTGLRAKGGDKKNEEKGAYLPNYFRSWKVTLPSAIMILFTVCVRGGDKAVATDAATAAAVRGGAAEVVAAP
jgi:hypothetical protein